jgi:hypothetical protein
MRKRLRVILFIDVQFSINILAKGLLSGTGFDPDNDRRVILVSRQKAGLHYRELARRAA